MFYMLTTVGIRMQDIRCHYMFYMLTTVGIRVQDIKLMDCVQELSELDMDTTAIIDSGATRTIVPDDSYLVQGSIYELDKPVLFKGFDKKMAKRRPHCMRVR